MGPRETSQGRNHRIRTGRTADTLYSIPPWEWAVSFADLGIDFDALGIGSVLTRNRLRVPLNQRSYAWDQDHVRQLFEDFNAAILREEKTYFLGTIVLSHGSDDGRLLVADGQQRLATTSILLAAIRNHL